MTQNKPVRRVVVASSLGSVVEWYDYAIYGYFSVTLAQKFFPSDDPVASLLAVYGVFAVTSITRPFGGLVFGTLGDRVSRRFALMLSVFAIGLGTTLVAALPTYETAGILAPILLTVLRMLQGLAVGGEYTGASIYVAEHAPARRRGFLTSIVEASTDVGWLLGSAVGALTAVVVGEVVMQEWGWRVPFALGGVLALATLIFRSRLPLSPVDEEEKPKTSPIIDAVRQHWRTMLHFQGLMLVAAAGFYVVFVYGTSYIEQEEKFSVASALNISTIAMVLVIIAALSAGYLSDKIGRRPIFIAVALGAILFSWPLMALMTTPTVPTVLLGEAGFAILFGAAFGVLPATMAEMLPPAVRCSGAGVAYNTCVAVVAGTSPLIAAFLVAQTGMATAPAFFIMVAGVIQLPAALALRERSGADLLT